MVLEISDLLYSLFVGRNDVYSEQYLSGKKKAFKKVKGIITPNLIEEHLQDKVHLGVYQLDQESKVKWGCLDFDENTQEDFVRAKKVYEYAISKGFHPCFEYSGGGEYKVHVIFFTNPIPARQMRLFLDNICKGAKVQPHEIFPKQDEISKGEYGNLLKLPLGINLSTGNKSFFTKDYEKIKVNETLRKKLEFHLTNKDEIKFEPQEIKQELTNPKIRIHKWDSFFTQTLKQELPEGSSKEFQIGTREAGINNNLLKNQARWFFEKGYSEEMLEEEIKPLYLNSGRSQASFNNLKGWFKKCEKGHIVEINKKELKDWAETYSPSLGLLIPTREEEKKNAVVQEVSLKDFEYFKKLKKNKDFLVDEFLYPGSINMIYSPPAHFKSLIALQLAMTISNGKKFLGMKTKKFPVLYCDGENSEQMIKERLKKIYKGLNLKRNKFPLFFLTEGLIMDEKKNIHFGFELALEKIIEENNIKVLIFDTMHRFAYYDENSSDDINKLYTKLFKPFARKYNLAIVFLHHSRKDGGYRGSGDFLGMVDVSYKVSRQGKTNKFRIVNEKSRSGEIQDLLGEIVFNEEYIKFSRLNVDSEKETIVSKLKEATGFLRGFFEKRISAKNKDILDFIELENIEISPGTLKRSLKFLVDGSYLDKTERGVYSLIQR